MYGFHKVKNDRGVHEFKHPQFKKDHYDELAHIKRKNILIGRGDEQQEKELDTEEFDKLKDKLDATKGTLEAVTQQNINLISANKEVAGQLYNFKQDYENRLSKFFFMFYFIVNSKNEELLNLLKKTLMDLGIYYEDDTSKSIDERTLEAAEYINHQVLVNSNCDHTIMNKLLNAFTFYVNVGDHSIEDLYYPEDLTNKMNERIGYDNLDYNFKPFRNIITSSERSEKGVSYQSQSDREHSHNKEMKLAENDKLMEEEVSSDNEFDLEQIYDESVDQRISDYKLSKVSKLE